MNETLTELVFLLDRSGSMSGLEEDTIGGFNAMLQQQKEAGGRAYVSTVLFDHESQVVHDRVDLEKVEPMTGEQYFVRGSTALLDALGGAIHHIANVHRYARKEDRPGKTLFVITTDGMENSSRWYSAGKVKQMVEREREQYGWEFLFLGANLDAIAAAAACGIEEDHAVRYQCDSRGTSLNFEAISMAVGHVRSGKKLDKSWKCAVEADYRDRGEP